MDEPIEPPASSGGPTRLRRAFSRIVDVGLWCVVVVALYLAFGRRNRGPEVGAEAAQVVLSSPVDERKVTIPGTQERPLLIKAFASWCGACKRAAWYDDPTSARESGTLEVLAVSLDDTPEEALQAQRDWPIPFEVLHDKTGSFARAYQVSILPTYILIGSDGTVKRVTSGMPSPLDLKAWAQAE